MTSPGARSSGDAVVFAALRGLVREGPVEVTVRGGCMAPLLADGGRARVASARFYLPGDVVVFRAADGRLLAHRLLGYRLHAGRLALVTRGDACAVHDAPVLLGALLGRVEAAPPTAALRLRALLRFLGLAGRALRRR